MCCPTLSDKNQQDEECPTRKERERERERTQTIPDGHLLVSSQRDVLSFFRYPNGMGGTAAWSQMEANHGPYRGPCCGRTNVCVCMQMSLHIYTYKHFYMHMCGCVCAHENKQTHAYIYACIHTYINAYMNRYIHACMHTYIHTYTYVFCMRAYIHLCKNYFYTHMYIHTCISVSVSLLTSCGVRDIGSKRPYCRTSRTPTDL